MQYSVFKITEHDHEFFLYFVSPFGEQQSELALESAEHWISNNPELQMNQYLMTIDFDKVTCEKVSLNPADVVAGRVPHDPKCVNVSQEYLPLIPPPKPKREPKKKAEKPPKEPKQPKPRGKKSTQKVEISNEPTVLNMNQ